MHGDTHFSGSTILLQCWIYEHFPAIGTKPKTITIEMPRACKYTLSKENALCRSYLISLHIAEYYMPDRLLRQFGKSQVIPVGPPKWARREKGGLHPTTWSDELASEISDWRQRERNVVKAATDKYSGMPTKDYMAWYNMFTHRYGNTPLCPPSQSQSNTLPPRRP
ncbi:hypothetical protein AMTR_s00028p00241840 [Amborella trichopoda]|uniref:Aminotransferase-like plant mobile domain-containing protein n=1 Tax=Amborella trichopoda TaxID=13333 RepID=W1PTT4_AMBTC|nr:hypothetical protein AMTR_s00028p00241840 [Amborella trichopoda]